MKRKLLYLVNPISGARDKSSLKDLIAARTRAEEIDFAFYPSVESGDYSFLFPIIKEENFTDVIIAGGDGTINKAVSSLRKLGVRFGILPFGSGNGLAFSAMIPKNIESALRIIFRGNSKLTDAFTINDVFACMLCGLGFDAQVAHDFANDPKRGLTTYIRKTISNFFTAHTYPFEITTGGKKIITEAFFISVANSNQFGNNFTIAPKASLHDGLLDIVIMTKQNKLSVLVQALMQVGGFNQLQKLEMINERAGVLYFQTNELTIRNPGSAPMHIDGDPVETMKELSILLKRDCFRLIYP